MRKVTVSILLMCVVLLMVSCSTTQVISSWSVDNPDPASLKKVLVLSVMKNRESSGLIEQAMVGELNKAGIDASAAMDVFGPKGFRGLTEEEVASKLNGSDYTSVMIVSLVDKESEESYTPGTRYATPRIVGYSRYYRRYIVVYDQMYTPGYYTSSTNYVLEADIYTVNDDDELLYSTQTRSYDPNSISSLAASFARSIVTELKTKGFIMQ